MMTDRTPTTEAGRRHVAEYTLPEELQAVLDIEDEAREEARKDFVVIGADNLAYLQGKRDGADEARAPLLGEIEKLKAKLRLYMEMAPSDD